MQERRNSVLPLQQQHYRSCFFPWSQFFSTSVQEFTTTSKVVLKRLNISKPDSSEAQKSATQDICSDIVDSNYWKQRTQNGRKKIEKIPYL
jgi:hypothetical protein